MSILRTQSARPEPPPHTAATEAAVNARAVVREAIDALERLAAGDEHSADRALKRVLMAAGDARAALQPALVAKVLPPELKDWA